MVDPGPEFWESVHIKHSVKRPIKRLENSFEGERHEHASGEKDSKVQEGNAEEGEIMAYVDDVVLLRQFKLGHQCKGSWECTVDLVCLDHVCRM
jgi:hypothetical protein